MTRHGVSLVDRKLPHLAVKRELAVGDAVAVATDERAHRETERLVFTDGVPAERNVRSLPLAVRCPAADEAAAKVGDLKRKAVGALQGVERRLLSEFSRAKGLDVICIAAAAGHKGGKSQKR